MKKTLILLFVVLMTATLFVACSSSPEKENYSVKVVLEGAKENGTSLEIDGTYYMNDKTVTTKSVTDVAYVLYSDPTCEKATSLFLYLNNSDSTEYYVQITDNEDINWYSENKAIEAGATIEELSVKASDTHFIDLKGDSKACNFTGSVTMYAREDVVLTINCNPE